MAARVLSMLGRSNPVIASVRSVTQRYADRYKNLAVGSEDQSRHTESVGPYVRHEDIFDIGQLVGAIETPPSEHRCARQLWTSVGLQRDGLVRVGFQIGEIDEPVFIEPRTYRHIPQAKPAALACMHGWHVRDRLLGRAHRE